MSSLYNQFRMRSESCSVMSDSVTPWTVAHQAPLSMGFPRQEYWSGLSFPSLGEKAMAPHSSTLAWEIPWTKAAVHGVAEGQTRLSDFTFSRGSSWPRDWTQVSCIAGRFFSIWATREAPMLLQMALLHFFYGWIIFHCIYVPHLYPFICWWT